MIRVTVDIAIYIHIYTFTVSSHRVVQVYTCTCMFMLKTNVSYQYMYTCQRNEQLGSEIVQTLVESARHLPDVVSIPGNVMYMCCAVHTDLVLGYKLHDI